VSPSLQPALPIVALWRSDSRWLRGLLALIVLLAGVGIAVPAGPGWDFANFYDTGRRAAAGQIADIYSPTRLIAGAAPQGTLSYWSPPLSAYFFAPLAWLPPLGALAAFKAAGTLAWMAALWMLYQLHAPHAGAGADAQVRFAAAMAAALLLFQPIWAIYRIGGQTTPFVLLSLTVALRAHQRGRRWTMAGAVVLACLFKPAFALVPALLLVASGAGVWVALATVAAAVAALSVGTIGWPLHREFLDVARQGATAGFGWAYNSSLFVLAETVRDAQGQLPPLAGTIVTVVKAGLGAVILHAAWQARSLTVPAAAARHYHMVLAITGALILSQVVWEHYLALLLPLWTYLLAVEARLSAGTKALLATALVACVWQNMVVVNLLRTLIATDTLAVSAALALAKSLPLLLTAILVVRARREWLDTYRASSWQNAPRVLG
jgi:Glycosyltransferase family 87